MRPVACRNCTATFEPEHRFHDECPACSARMVESCAECGQPDNARYVGETREAMLARSLCFNCTFWLQRVEAVRSNPAAFVAKGNAYQDAGNKPGRDGDHNLGFYGQRWRITFDDGRVVETNNLFGQGTVPERFRDRLPDTATLVALDRHGNPQR